MIGRWLRWYRALNVDEQQLVGLVFAMGCLFLLAVFVAFMLGIPGALI